jgi:hypothetical protein
MTPAAKLRTKPEEASHVEIPERGWRRQSDGGRFGIFTPPGSYTVELEVGADVVGSQSLEILKDPGSAGSEEEIAEQMVVLAELRQLIEGSVETINGSEWTRKQLYDLRTVWKALRLEDEEESSAPAEEPVEGDSAMEGPQDLLTAIEDLDEKLKELEGLYFDLRLTGASQDSLRWKRLLSAQLTRLAWGIASADVRPTDAQLEFFAEIKQQAEAAEAAWAAIRDEAIPALNALAREQGVEAVILAESGS